MHTAVPSGHEYPTISLTFDACGDANASLADVALLDTLRREGVPATLFLNERWVRDHPQLTRILASDPLFQIGNHGTRHVPLSVTGRAAVGVVGTTSAHEVVKEILDNQQTLADLAGTQPRWFRPGTGYYDDVAVEIATELGFALAGCTVNADRGATATPRQVADALADAPDGAIVLLHMDRPFGGTGAGLRTAIPRLREQGVRFTHLPQPTFP
ncbi:polysaccharide deacetylase family protein [Rhodococcus sp. O3]|uniref:polysaccharide deacetylase family protein n=1 Tax=Rhodococcus sp. O3 TaxID=3404919 RepID=UPI003B679A93